MHGKTQIIIVAAALTALLAGAAAAQETVNKTLKADADGTVLIKNLAGFVTITGWDRDEVKLEATLDRKVERLDFERNGGRVVIEVVYPRRVRNVDGSELIIHLPRGSRVEASTVSADIEVEDVDGALELSSVSGDVDASGEPSEVDVETVSGAITLTVGSDEAHAKSVSGDILLRGVRGSVDVETVSGDMEVEGGRIDRFRGNSVSGDCVFDAELTDDGSYVVENHSGDTRFYLRGDVNAEFEVTTFSGDIDNEFGPEAERTSKFTPGRELRFTAGSGDARVEIETFSGDVELIRK
jgi:DUF4097 and DUF4098 domain-containing protein YvlB